MACANEIVVPHATRSSPEAAEMSFELPTGAWEPEKKRRCRLPLLRKGIRMMHCNLYVDIMKKCVPSLISNGANTLHPKKLITEESDFCLVESFLLELLAAPSTAALPSSLMQLLAMLPIKSRWASVMSGL